MVAGLVDGVQLAVDGGEGAGDTDRAVCGQFPVHAPELVRAAAADGRAHITLVVGEDRHAEPARAAHLGPARRRLADAQQDEGRFEGERGEGLAGEADGFARIGVQGGDHGDARGEVAEDIAERGRVQPFHRWPQKLSEVISFVTQVALSTIRPSKPYSTWKPPGACA